MKYAYLEKDVILTQNARTVLERRYLKKDDQGKPMETPRDMFLRVASTLAAADKKFDKRANVDKATEEFYTVMTNLEFLPNSPTLMNAGRDLGQLSACFVLPIDDTMEDIFDAVKNAALIHKSGGGTGFSFSRLRPKNSQVKTTGGVASGPVSFLKVFDSATQAVKQGGTRRGANMGILRVDHPDILEFISCKEKDREISNFNISVGVTEEFMRCVEADQEYDLVDPHTGGVVERLRARQVFDLITEMAYKNGEPGVVFLDRMNKDNPTPALGQIESTNPCGEQPLLPYESCNLGSINLATMVKDGQIQWKRLAEVTATAVHFLDNVIEVNKFPLPLIEKMTKMNRKIGLGVMGFADFLIQLGIAYNSEAALETGQNVMQFIQDEAINASVKLAEKRGVPASFEQSRYNDAGKPRVRNMTLTTIAPTGTLSILADCSSGIEPLFALAYYRNVMDNDKLMEFNPALEKALQARGLDTPELRQKIAAQGNLHGIEEVPEPLRRIFVTAHDISPEWHVRMQAAFQKYTHNAVSKTINFAHEATLAEVRESYILAYRLGAKGLTIYRDRSREAQVLNIAGNQPQTQTTGPAVEDNFNPAPRPRPQAMHGITDKIATGCGNLYVTINDDENGGPFEVFMQMGKAGGCAASQLEAIGRLASLALRSGIDAKQIVEQLEGIRCPSPSWGKGGRTLSCSDAIARVVERRLRSKDNGAEITKKAVSAPEHEENGVVLAKLVDKAKKNIVGVCPDCSAALYHVEGCSVCRACGYTKCG
ncbi:MAG: vitamin B12-dependent ribonucleotide reductase [Candidatus Omnitrophica bacterium]|nr:vitamin B12-dependent ribonucleotide reductase [Candidatus Omnitrophota bacterium]